MLQTFSVLNVHYKCINSNTDGAFTKGKELSNSSCESSDCFCPLSTMPPYLEADIRPPSTLLLCTLEVFYWILIIYIFKNTSKPKRKSSKTLYYSSLLMKSEILNNIYKRQKHLYFQAMFFWAESFPGLFFH